MNLNDLLIGKNLDPRHVLVLRHRPSEPEFNKVFPWIVAERPDLFDAYQQFQNEKLEKTMSALGGVGYLASFIAYGPGRALFIGLYKVGSSKPYTYSQYWKLSSHIEMKAHGLRGFTGDRRSILRFDLNQLDFYADWKGKLIVDWPPPERSWWRRAHRNLISVRSILEESALASAMKAWDELNLSWSELGLLPARLRAKLSEWRAIYFIFDTSDGKGYVGSAYGADNLLGRWLNYAASGHGGNRLLRQRDRQNFRFSILQRVSPDTSPDDVIRLESTWKGRLHTRAPHGLNDN